MFGLQPLHIAVIVFVALLVFGPARIPELARSLGRAIVEFKQAAASIETEMAHGLQETSRPTVETAHKSLPTTVARVEPEHESLPATVARVEAEHESLPTTVALVEPEPELPIHAV